MGVVWAQHQGGRDGGRRVGQRDGVAGALSFWRCNGGGTVPCLVSPGWTIPAQWSTEEGNCIHFVRLIGNTLLT